MTERSLPPISPEDVEALEELDRDVKKYANAFDELDADTKRYFETFEELERDEALEAFHRDVEKYRLGPEWTPWDFAAIAAFTLIGCLFWIALFVRFFRQS